LYTQLRPLTKTLHLQSLLFLISRVLHFATEAELKIIRGLDNLSKMDHNESSCIAFGKEYILSSIVREYLRKEKGMDEHQARDYWNKVKDDHVIESVTTTVDFRLFTSRDRDKDNFQTEVNALARRDNTTVKILDVLGWMNASFHRLHYNLRTGGKLSTIILSTTVLDAAFNREIPPESDISKIDGHIAHSEVFLAGYIQDVVVYTDDLVKYFDGVMSSAFGEIFRQVLKVEEPFMSTMALRHRNGNLSPEDIEALRKMLLESRIKGGKTSGYMRTLVTAIVNHFVLDMKMETEDALDQLETVIGDLIDGVQFENQDVMNAYNQLVEHQEKIEKRDVKKLASNTLTY